MANVSRSNPAPFDLTLNGDPWMLETDEANNLMYEQSKMQFSRNVITPGAQPYAIADPKLEAPRGFFSFDSGMGFREEAPQADQDTNGYYYGLYIDDDGKSILNGPLVTTVTPTTTSAIKQFFEFTVGGTRKLCAVAATNVLVRDADSAAGWVNGQTITAGRRATVFRGEQSGDFAYIAQGTDANIYTWTGASNTTTFALHASEAAIALAVDTDKMWFLSRRTGGANNGYIVRTTHDGGATPTLGGDFVITELANPAVDMTMFDDRLFVGTERGLFAPSESSMEGLDFRSEYLTPAFAYQRNANNTLGMTPWFEWLITPMAGSLFRYSTDGSFPEFGLGSLPDNISEVQGVPTAICGYRNWTLFVAFYSAIQDASYLMRWGDWQWRNTQNGPQRAFVPGWHGALYKFSGVQVDALFVSEVTGGPRLWVGDDDGKISYITLPRYSMSWVSDTACRFNITNPGQVYFPRIYHGVRFEPKANLAVAIACENLSGSTQYIDVTYRTTPTGSFGGAADLVGSGRFNTDPGGRANFNTAANSRMTDLLATLTTTVNTTPAILRSIALYQCVRPTYKWIYSFSVRLGPDVISHAASSLRRFFGEDSQISSIESVGSNANPVTLITPRGESVSVLVTDVKLRAKNRRSARDPLEWTATFECMMHRTLDVLGTWTELNRFTWSFVNSYTWGQIGSL